MISPQVYYGETQCPGGRSFSPKPDLRLRVDADAGGLRGSVQEVAGFDRPVCNISGSQMFPIFFSLPRSQCSGDGCASSKLEWVAGVCLSSLVSHSDGFEEAPVVLWSHSDHRSSILASEAGVSGSSGSGGRQLVALPQVQRPSASVPLPPVFLWECPGCVPRSFEVPSLGDFAAGMPEDLLLCPVRALSAYLDRT